MQPEDATIVESWWRERWLTTSDSQYRGAIVRGLVLKTVQHELEEDKPAKGHKARKTVRRLPSRFVWSWGATFKPDLKWSVLMFQDRLWSIPACSVLARDVKSP